MKKSLAIFTFLFGLILQSYGSHILGGEITYTHISDLKYKIQLIIYRDCNGCKLQGAGGGESNVDCGKVDLFLATSANSSCGRQNLAKLTIERKKIQELLPLCGNVKSKCNSNSNISFGIEAHYFETEVNFDNYNSYKGCSFDIYTNISWRTKGISTIFDDQTFYNYARINPWVAHNSPKMNNEISPVVFCNQPVYYSHGVADIDRDSLSFHLVPALSDYNSNVAYKTGYSAVNPLDAYCTSGTICDPDPAADPPLGFSFNAKSGDLVFTPVNCSQTAVVVLEIRKWRNINGKPEIISAVRRDLQYIVLSGSENNPPRYTRDLGVIEICAGEEVCFDIDVNDKPFKYPDNTLGPQQNVRLYWDGNINGATFQQVNTNESGKFKARFCWTPGMNKASSVPYQFTVFANDSACPLNAISSKTIQILVKAKPNVSISVSKTECGYLQLNAAGSNLSQYFWKVNAIGNPSFDYSSTNKSATVKTSLPGKYVVLFEGKSQNNCSSQAQDSVVFSDSDYHPYTISFLGKTTLCEGDSILLNPIVDNNYSLNSLSWYRNGASVNGAELKKPAQISQSGNYLLITEAVKNGFTCTDSVSFNLTVNGLPAINGRETLEACELSDNAATLFQVSPTGGKWSSDIADFTSEAGNLNAGSIADRKTDKSVKLTYEFTEAATGCSNAKAFSLTLKKLPGLVTEDAALCKGVGNFYIDNLVVEPLLKSDQHLSISFENVNVLLETDPINGRLFINPMKYNNGDYNIFINNKGENGCYSYDTAVLALMDQLKIRYNNKDTFCSGINRDMGQLFGVFPKGGGWYSPDHYEWTNGNTLLAEACGSFSLSYVYDKWGCYDQLNLLPYAECLPDITFDNRFDSICSNYSPVNLLASPTGGNWSGVGVSANIFNPAGLSGINLLTYRVNGKVCSKNADFPVIVTNAASLDLSSLSTVICEGDELDLTGIKFSGNHTEIAFGNGTVTYNSVNGKFISYRPSLSENENGGFGISAVAQNNGLCYEVKHNHQVKISRKAGVAFNGDFIGCEPFTFEPKAVFALHNSVINGVSWNLNGIGFKQNSQQFAPSFTIPKPGKYHLTLQTANSDGCIFSFEFKDLITVNPTPVASFTCSPDNFASVFNPEFYFNNTSKASAASKWNWDFGTHTTNGVSDLKNPVFTYPHDTGTYEVKLTVENEYGCSSSFSKWLHIGPDIQIFIPNAFTPDQKGPEQNATFNVIASNIMQYSIVIVNRWGQIVFKSDDINEGWDGNTVNSVCLPGVYVYKINLKSNTGKEYNYSGTINLIR